MSATNVKPVPGDKSGQQPKARPKAGAPPVKPAPGPWAPTPKGARAAVDRALKNVADEKAKVERLEKLKKQGYIVKPIKTLNILDETKGGDVRTIYPGGKGAERADIVVNGTFYGETKANRLGFGGGQIVPAGPTLHDGQYDRAGGGSRGGVAVLKDGTVRIGRATDPTLPGIQKRFGEPGNPVTQFMGGGAQIIKDHGDKTDLKGQGFEEGIASPQFRATQHTMVGADDNGQSYLIVNEKPKSGAELQRDLKGFNEVIVFDGGNPSVYHEKNKKPMDGVGRAPLGMAIEVQK